MQLLSFNTERDVQWIRWIARILSFLFAGFIFYIWLFNEDVRQNPTPPTIVVTIIAVFMVVSWRWEKIGGTLTVLASPFCLLSVMYMTTQMDSNLVLAFAVGLALTFVTALIGWLFISVAQHTAVGTEGVGASEKPRRGRYLLYAAIVLVVIVLFALSVVGAPFSEVRTLEDGVGPGTPIVVFEEAGSE